MAHNLTLPTHRYAYVLKRAVMDVSADERYDLLPCVWWGVSVTPNRMLGCHILLESGAMVVDVPLVHMRSHDMARENEGRSEGIITWDCYGWDAEIVQNDYLAGTQVHVLDKHHKATGMTGRLWFAIDHIKDGFSMEPAQHKHLWVVAMNSLCDFSWVPQDQLLLTDKSFTVHQGIPKILRQDTFRSVE